MNLELLKDEKDSVRLQFENENSTLALALNDELWQAKGTDAATVSKKHPLVGKPELLVQGKEPKKLIKAAAQSFKKKVEEFEKALPKDF